MTEPAGQPGSRGEFLRARNALWRELRQRDPEDPEFERLLGELRRLTGLSVEQVLAGLGLPERRP